MNAFQSPPNLLYRRLLTLRYVLPFAAFLPIIVFETFEHFSPWTMRVHLLAPFRYVQLEFLLEFLVFGLIGPTVVWLTLTWIAQRVRERDQAEAHLRSMYQMSHHVIMAAETEALLDLALRMPHQVADAVRTSVILQEHPHGPWMLVGTHGFRGEQQKALEAYLMSAGASLRCSQCTVLSATARQSCPLLSALPEDLEPAAATVICLPLSAERPAHAMLNIYLPEKVDLAPATRQVLESMSSALGVAMDRAHLRAQALEIAYYMEKTVRGRDGLGVNLNHILVNIATAVRAEEGAVFLAFRHNGKSALIPIAFWPGEGIHSDLTLPARQALHGGSTVVNTESGERGQVMAVPLVAEGVITGILVLAGRPPFSASVASVLNVAPGMIALMIRNNQLYAELESQAVLEERSRLAREVHDGLAQTLSSLNFKIQQVDRLLAGEQWEAARQALRESREVILNVYAEVRLSLQALRWPLEEGQGVADCLDQFVAAFANRTGLDVSLTVDGDLNLCSRAKVQLFRVVQEALTNVQKHARARRAWVRLSAHPEGVTLEVEDDGVGLPAEYGEDELPPEAAGHFGLRIIRERVEALGGRMSLHTAPGQSTKLRITVPAPDILTEPKVGSPADLYGPNGFSTIQSRTSPHKLKELRSKHTICKADDQCAPATLRVRNAVDD